MGKFGGVKCWIYMRDKMHKAKLWGEINNGINICAFLCKDCVPSMEVEKNTTNRLVYKDLIAPTFKRRGKIQFLNMKGIRLDVRVPTLTVHLPMFRTLLYCVGTQSLAQHYQGTNFLVCKSHVITALK